MTRSTDRRHCGARARLRKGIAWMALACFAAAAQAPGDVRVALVIGNSAYLAPAALINPANDADAMSSTLRTLGFTVVELKDASRSQMVEAIGKVGDSLKGRQGIGMLYYAGHGLQLDFRNYMVPVDANISHASDVPARALDLGNVIDAFKSAGNRMNIVVLDACRDNPFAGQASGKGLAPLDAPTGTFLAYATAPGNVAEDGDEAGGNGLYTGYLVKELQRPATRIEDVFKRVRLQVRQKSNGRQVPWESTSLEDDFFFNDGVKHTFRQKDLERLAAEAKQKEQQLLRQAEAAREKERRAAQQLELERQRAAQAAKDAAEAEEKRLVAEAKAREALRLNAEAKARDEARRAAEAKAREEQRLAVEAAALASQQKLLLAQQQEQERLQAAARALEQVRAVEVARLKELDLAAARSRESDRLKRLSTEEAREEAFRIEKADWDRIKNSKLADDFYAFLNKYPSGNISELAQLRLEQLAKAQIQSQPDKDGKVQPSALTRYRDGDRYELLITEGLTNLSRKTTAVTRKTGADEFTIDMVGLFDQVVNSAGFVLRESSNQYDPPWPTSPGGDFQVGKQWKSRYIATSRTNGQKRWTDMEAKVVAKERITTPLGTFDTFRVDYQMVHQIGSRTELSYWFDPEWGFPLKTVRVVRPRQSGAAPDITIREVTARSRAN